MLIDWFTVGAQIVNFLILIYLLKRFLYKPILKAMAEREQKITGRLQQAAEKREQAASEAAALAEEHRELANNKTRLQEKAKAEIEQWREEAMGKAKEEVNKTQSSWQENLEREKDDFIRKMKATLSRRVFRVAAKALQDLADESLEAKLVEKFNRKLPEAAAENEEAEGGMGDKLQIKSGFELNTEQQKAVRTAIADLFPQAVVDFQVEPEIGFGIRLVGNNRKIDWSLSRYMDELEEHILKNMQLAPGKST